jgi:hypothetical protein
MARYTTELRDIVKSGLKVFNFEYTFYDETKKTDFEQAFIDHFLFREIGVETVGRFQHYLKVKCNEVLPFYNEVLKAAQLEYDILYNYDMSETFTKTNSNTRAMTENVEQEGTANATATTSGVRDQTVESTLTGEKTNTLESITNHTEETDNTHNQTDNETGTQDKTSTVEIDGRKVGSETPNGLLSMTDIKNNVYASKADIEDTTNTTTDKQTSAAEKTSNSTDNTTGTATDNVNATSRDESTERNDQVVHETNSATSHNNGSTTANTNSTQNETQNGNENYTLKRIGNIGVMHATDMIEKHVALQRKIRTAYMQFFDECEDLFMQIY